MMKRSIWIAVIATLGVTLGTTPLGAGDAKAKHNQGLALAAFDIAGVWMGGDPAMPGVYTQPLLTTDVITAVDPFGRCFVHTAQGVNGDPTFMGLFPDATQLATQVGTIVRTGRRTYMVTSVQYFGKPPEPGTELGTFDRGQVLYFFVISGTIEMLDANTKKAEGTMAFYSKVDRPEALQPWFGIFGVHNQDQDNDGLPDAGEEPFVCFPFGGITKRLPLMEPCTPLEP